MLNSVRESGFGAKDRGSRRAVYDYEDPDVAKRFLMPSMQGLEGFIEALKALKGQELWSLLPPELAIETLWSAGLQGAVAAMLSCKDWGAQQIAEGIRERAYFAATGAGLRSELRTENVFPNEMTMMKRAFGRAS